MEPIFTAEQLAEIKTYHLPYYIRSALNPFLLLGYLALVLGPLNGPFYRSAQRAAAWLDSRLGFLRRTPGARVVLQVLDKLWGEPGWGTALLFGLFVDLTYKLVFLPADIYFGYILEHRYGMSTYTPLTFARDQLKDVLAGVVLVCSLVLGVYGLARRVRRWWLVLGVPMAVLLLLVSSVLDPYRSRAYFDQTPLEEGPLRTRMTELLARADITFADILVEKTSVASKRVQAYFAGQGPTRTIVLNDVLLQQFTEGEILAAVAHEAGHVNESQWPNRIASALSLVAFLFAIDWLLRRAAARGWFGSTRFADIRTLPLISLLYFSVMLTAAPVSAAFSREREREADRYALRLTNDPATFRQMLVKAARVNKMDPEPPQWIVIKGLTHPPIGERISDISVP
jgi:STE24 endopeptidase